MEVVLRTVENPPGWCGKFVDDSFVAHKLEHKESFLKHINSINQSIKFTVEDTCPYSSIPFLDTLVTPEPNRTLSISVYRKPTHTDQYLHWDSHHHISEYSVYQHITLSYK